MITNILNLIVNGIMKCFIIFEFIIIEKHERTIWYLMILLLTIFLKYIFFLNLSLLINTVFYILNNKLIKVSIM